MIPLTFITLSQFYGITSLVIFTKNKKLLNEGKEGLFCIIWLLQHVTLYKRRYKIMSLNTIAFLETHVCINNAHRQRSRIIISLCKSCIVISVTLIDLSFSCCSSFKRIPEEKIELQKRVHRSTWVGENTFLAAWPSFYVIFCRFFRLLPAFRQLRFYMKKIFCPRKYCWNPPWKVSRALKIFTATYSIKLIIGYQISQLFLEY